MTRLSVSVVVESVTTREGMAAGRRLGEALSQTLTALASQIAAVPNGETIVVIDDTVTAADAEDVRQRFPAVKLVHSSRCNYFDAKNAGAAAASGAIIAMLDGDTVPDHDWLDTILQPFEPGVDVVAGCTRFAGHSLLARTFSITDFAGVVEDDRGSASGFNVNNVAFRRAVLEAHPLDARIRRNGGCYLLYNQLRKAGVRMVYEPRARVGHGFQGIMKFVQTHFDRGFDGISIYRLDDQTVLRGTPFVRRFGVLAVPPLMMRRLAVDWFRLIKYRRQMGVPTLAMPYFAAVMMGARLIQSAGAFASAARGPRHKWSS